MINLIKQLFDSFKGNLNSISFKMRLSFAFLLLLAMQVSANNVFSQNEIQLDMKNTSLKLVLDEIKEQTGYSFFYNVNEVQDQMNLSIVAKKETLEQVLKKISAKLPIDYTINEKQVVLTSRAVMKPANVAMQQVLKGTVTDIAGVPLPGANILVKGTTVGAQTNFDGEFTIDVPEGSTILVVSYIGFKSTEVDVTGKSEVTIQLQEDAGQLDAVVVFGSRGKPRTAMDSPVPVDN